MSNDPIVSRDPTTLRLAATAIASSYDASPAVLRTQGWNQAIIYCDLTLNTATDVRLKVEFASPPVALGLNGAGSDTPATGDWFRQTYADSAAAAGSGLEETCPVRCLELILPATGRYAIPVQLNYKYMRVSAKTTGAPGSTTLLIYATVGRA